MTDEMRTGDPSRFNKGRSSKFREGSRVLQTSEEGRRTYWPKRCGNNNRDENNSPKTLNDKNHQVSFQKFRQLCDAICMSISIWEERNGGFVFMCMWAHVCVCVHACARIHTHMTVDVYRF